MENEIKTCEEYIGESIKTNEHPQIMDEVRDFLKTKGHECVKFCGDKKNINLNGVKKMNALLHKIESVFVKDILANLLKQMNILR